MTPAASRPVVRRAIWTVGPLLLLAILRPWTIRPLQAGNRAAFAPTSVDASAWPRLVREAEQSAGDVSLLEMPAGGSPAKARFIKGTGVVTAVDRGSRVGVMRVPLSGPASVAIQIGPVIRGTALRDASSFIQ